MTWIWSILFGIMFLCPMSVAAVELLIKNPDTEDKVISIAFIVLMLTSYITILIKLWE